MARVAVTIEQQALFSRKAQNDALRASMLNAGNAFIADRLPLRFTAYAKEALGYSGKKGATKKSAMRLAIIAHMRHTGEQDKLIRGWCAPWGGWNPLLRREAPRRDVFDSWFKTAVKTGKIRTPKTAADWGKARKVMRAEVIQQAHIIERLNAIVAERMRDFDPDMYTLPLVSSGFLRESSAREARARVSASKGLGNLRITIPRHGRQNQQVITVLGAVTNGEVHTVQEQITADLRGFYASSRPVSKRSQRRAFSKKTQRGIAAILSRSRQRS